MSVLSPPEASCPGISSIDVEELRGFTQESTGSESERRHWTINKLFRAGVVKRLARLQRGRLTLVDGAETFEFGRRESIGLHATVNIRDARAYRFLAMGGSLGAAEAYLQHQWTCEDLVTFFRFMIRNTQALRELDRGWSQLRAPFRWVERFLDRNTKSGSRRNIAAHYDLSNEFFALFLDETMTYSSGIFEHPSGTLEEASIAKYDRLCRKLELGPGDHVVEIGTGWGGFAIHAAGQYGCRVTTTTISREQHDLARRRIEEAGLDHLVTLQLRDYRDLEGSYDKLVSIEMIEAVGHEFLETYYKKCASLLKPGGRMAIQAITIGEEEFDRYRGSTDFIQRYVFPGGCLPSPGSLNRAAQSTGQLRLDVSREFGAHYATTIAHWRRRFRDRLEAVHSLGFDDRFVRMWNYYLCYCEAGFREGKIGLSQLVYSRR